MRITGRTLFDAVAYGFVIGVAYKLGIEFVESGKFDSVRKNIAEKLSK